MWALSPDDQGIITGGNSKFLTTQKSEITEKYSKIRQEQIDKLTKEFESSKQFMINKKEKYYAEKDNKIEAFK